MQIKFLWPKGNMWCVPMGGTVRHGLKNHRTDVCDTWVRVESGGVGWWGNEGTYAIRGYGWNGEAWVDELSMGRMRYVGTGWKRRYGLKGQDKEKNHRRDVCDTWVRVENGGMDWWGKTKKKIIEGTYAIRGYGLKTAAWIDGARQRKKSTNGGMR